MKLSSAARSLVLVPALALFGLAAPAGCDDGDDAADGDTGGHGEHGEHGGSDTADPDTMVEWTTPPPATVAAGEAVEGTFMVHTAGELHVTEMRACMGHGVADCGSGDMDTFDVTVPASDGTDAAAMHTGSLMLDAGDWTVVGYAHVGPDPFVSDPVDVTVQ